MDKTKFFTLLPYEKIDLSVSVIILKYDRCIAQS